MRRQTKILLVVAFLTYIAVMVAHFLYGQALGVYDSPAYSDERAIFFFQTIGLIAGFVCVSIMITGRDF